MMQRRWDPCIAHRGDDAKSFVADYLGASDRRILFIAGAGFDPRSKVVASLLSEIKSPVHAVLIKEERPNPDTALVDRGDESKIALRTLLPDNEVVQVDIFGSDGAVVGGRNAAASIKQLRFDGLTDVVVDISALSIGTSFPIIRFLVERSVRHDGGSNLHIVVVHDPALDEAIEPIAAESPGFVHGFRGSWALDATSSMAKLWLPQLARGRRATLQRLWQYLKPNETCPILPFPSVNPRLSDELAEHYLTELESAWEVDPRDIVYAAEDDPVDLYRTILDLDDLRCPVFAEAGGSMLILSPMGSKVMALGALLAALERNLPVAYLEAIGYRLDLAVPAESEASQLIHVWLEGGAYPESRPTLQLEEQRL